MDKPKQESRYRSLDPDKTVDTIKVLNRRIAERFPGSGLSAVGQELCQVALENKQKCEQIRRPILGLSRKIWQKIMILNKLDDPADIGKTP